MATTIELALRDLSKVDGFLFANLIDSESGMSMGSVGDGMDEELDAVAGSNVYRSVMAAMDTLDIQDEVEDNLISLGQSYQLLRPLDRNKTIFVHLALDRKRSNLAMARHALRKFVGVFSEDFDTI